MADWISWQEAVAIVALHFPKERAERLLHAVIQRGDAVEVWAADEGGVYLDEWPGYQYFDAQPGQRAGPDKRRHYRQINYVDLQSLKVWLKALTSDAALAPAPADGLGKVRRGGIEKADWEAYELAFVDKVAKDGYPDDENVKGWQRQADVSQWLAELVKQDGSDVSQSTLARHAKLLMERYRPHP